MTVHANRPDGRGEAVRGLLARRPLCGAAPAVALDALGFDILGPVLGCIVQQRGWQGYRGCGLGPGFRGPAGGAGTRVLTSAAAGYGPYVDGLNRGYRTALNRMIDQAQHLTADGIVGVGLTHAPRTHPQAPRRTDEFVAVGSAVRARSRHHPPVPFTTALAGTDVAKLLLAGWTPVALRVGLEVALRHDDNQTRAQARSRLVNPANVEVCGYTELLQHARALARDRLHRQIRTLGADGAVISDLQLRTWEIEPNDGHIDHVAEASITATAIGRLVRRRSPTTTLTMLPLRSDGKH